MRAMWRWFLDCFCCGSREDSGDQFKSEDELRWKLIAPAESHPDFAPGDFWDDERVRFEVCSESLEEDDVYMTHRKDAIEKSRSAAQHSKMASRSYQNGDHKSARLHSTRARLERQAATILHSEAAKEILAINNRGNDMWKLDLHGLHAAEALKALCSRLTEIETQSSRHHSLPPERGAGRSVMAGSASSGSLRGAARDSGPGVSSRQRLKPLLVITGKGNHSKGQPVLPGAVRGFLDEKGYRYDDTTPGVITVHPKLRGARSAAKKLGAESDSLSGVGLTVKKMRSDVKQSSL